jgi:hypothetical protein
MRANSQQAWLRFQDPGNLQKSLAVIRIVPPLIEVCDEPSGALDSVETGQGEAGVSNFAPQFIRMVEECIRKIVRIARRIPMLAVFQVPIDDVRESSIF